MTPSSCSDEEKEGGTKKKEQLFHHLFLSGFYSLQDLPCTYHLLFFS